MKIKLFQDFINEELTRIKSGQSNTGFRKEYDVIFDEPSFSTSPASGILLKDYLRDEEGKETLKMLKKYKEMTREEKREFFRQKSKKLEEWLGVPLNNLQFLKDRQEEVGTLRCEYCNKGPLKIYDFNPTGITLKEIGNKRFRFESNFNPEDGATCDHKQPMSKGGDKYDYENLAVCCNDCNKIKGNMSWEDWVKKMNVKESNLKSLNHLDLNVLRDQMR